MPPGLSSSLSATGASAKMTVSVSVSWIVSLNRVGVPPPGRPMINRRARKPKGGKPPWWPASAGLTCEPGDLSPGGGSVKSHPHKTRRPSGSAARHKYAPGFSWLFDDSAPAAPEQVESQPEFQYRHLGPVALMREPPSTSPPNTLICSSAALHPLIPLLYIRLSVAAHPLPLPYPTAQCSSQTIGAGPTAPPGRGCAWRWSARRRG